MRASSDNHVKSFLSGFNIKLGLIAWLAMLGFDFFLHGGVLAGIYTGESQFLLPSMEAFRRIPLGYLSFLITAFFLLWIALRLDINNVKDGLLMGLGLGVVMWAAFGLGMYSITTAEPSTLLAWVVSESLKMALAGGLIGVALRDQNLRQAFKIALVAAIFLVLLTIILQSLNLAPSTQIAQEFNNLPNMKLK